MTATAGATASPAGAAIETRGLTKRFGSILALDRLDLAVPRGSIFGLLGPNGAGKTTTIRILAGLARPTAGSALVAGVPVGLGQPELRRRLGYLDQDPRFYSWMKGRELLELVGRLHGLGGAELRSRVAGMLERTGLVSAAERRIGGYSGGMRQRIGIGQAMLPRPSVLFLDEPVSSLDPEPGQDAAVDALVATVRAQAWTRDVRVEHGLVRVFVTDADRAAIEMLPLVVATGVRLGRFERVRPTLEDVFLALVGTAGEIRA